MSKYTILGMARQETPTTYSVLVSVAYRDNETDEDDYFVCSFYDEQMQYKSGFYYDLCVYAEQVAGSELAYQLKRYLHTKANPWSGTMKVETLNYMIHEPFLWSEITSKDPMVPAFKKVTKKKISFTGPYDHGGPIAPAKFTSGPPRGIASLPGLNVRVNHPGETCESYSGGALLKNMIIHLNDQHKWTREKIADWLDEISDPTGETGPDLRFGAEPAKVEEPPLPDESPSAEAYLMSKGANGKSYHISGTMAGLENYKFTYDESYEFKDFPKLDQTHMHVELKDVSPEIIKLMTGESNEQD